MLNNFGVPSSTSKKQQPKRLLQLFHSLTGFKMTITINFSSQEFQLKIIIPLENLRSIELPHLLLQLRNQEMMQGMMMMMNLLLMKMTTMMMS